MSTRGSRDLNSAAPDPGIPVTREALARLEAETDRLATSLAVVQAEAQKMDVLGGDYDAPTLLTAGELHLVRSRLYALRRTLAAARVVEPNDAERQVSYAPGGSH